MFDNEFYNGGSIDERQAELGVAALHAVVASVGGTTLQAPHKLDIMGVDAVCMFQGVFTASQKKPRGITLNVQLKSTRSPKSMSKDGVEYWTLAIETSSLTRYQSWSDAFILAFFITPPEDKQEEWVVVNPGAITLRNCLYWTRLDKRPFNSNQKTSVVHIPQNNVLTPGALVNFLASLIEEETF